MSVVVRGRQPPLDAPAKPATVFYAGGGSEHLLVLHPALTGPGAVLTTWRMDQDPLTDEPLYLSPGYWRSYRFDEETVS